MKRSIKYIFVAGVVVASLASCKKQDEIYRKYVKLGGYDYPAKPINLGYAKGYQRVVVSWEIPMDPAVKTAKLYWDNYSKEFAIDYGKALSEDKDLNVKYIIDDKRVFALVAGLEDRSYTFNIVNFDADGNKSLASEITVSPYGDGWLVSRSERSVHSANMFHPDSAVIVFSKATDEMLHTRIRYMKKGSNDWTELKTFLEPGKKEIKLPYAQKGKRFEYSSCYRPKTGMDSVWRAWTPSRGGISYELSGKRWTTDVTTGQIFSESTPDKIFDGYYHQGFRYESSKSDATKNIFPKIITIDTKANVGDETAFTGFKFCLHPDNRSLRFIKNFSIYVGDKPYDKDDTKYAEHFGRPFFSGILSQSEAEQTISVSQGVPGRYLAIVFENSWSEDGLIDLWELIPYGYITSQVE